MSLSLMNLALGKIYESLNTPPVPQPAYILNVELPRGTVTTQVISVSEQCDCDNGDRWLNGEPYKCEECDFKGLLHKPDFTFGRVFTYDAKMLPVMLDAEEWKLVLAAAQKDWSENS